MAKFIFADLAKIRKIKFPIRHPQKLCLQNFLHLQQFLHQISLPFYFLRNLRHRVFYLFKNTLSTKNVVIKTQTTKFAASTKNHNVKFWKILSYGKIQTAKISVAKFFSINKLFVIISRKLQAKSSYSVATKKLYFSRCIDRVKFILNLHYVCIISRGEGMKNKEIGRAHFRKISTV